MKRSSPVIVCAMSACELPAFIANAARYRPAGQPSVRSTRSLHLSFRDGNARSVEQQLCLRDAHGEVFYPDLERDALRAKSRDGQRHLFAGTDAED